MPEPAITQIRFHSMKPDMPAAIIPAQRRRSRRFVQILPLSADHANTCHSTAAQNNARIVAAPPINPSQKHARSSGVIDLSSHPCTQWSDINHNPLPHRSAGCEESLYTLDTCTSSRALALSTAFLRCLPCLNSLVGRCPLRRCWLVYRQMVAELLQRRYLGFVSLRCYRRELRPALQTLPVMA